MDTVAKSPRGVTELAARECQDGAGGNAYRCAECWVYYWNGSAYPSMLRRCLFRVKSSLEIFLGTWTLLGRTRRERRFLLGEHTWKVNVSQMSLVVPDHVAETKRY